MSVELTGILVADTRLFDGTSMETGKCQVIPASLASFTSASEKDEEEEEEEDRCGLHFFYLIRTPIFRCAYASL